MKNKRAPVFLNRKIEIREDLIVISDEVVRKGNLTFKSLGILKDDTAMYVPTAGYFMETDMSTKMLTEPGLNEFINEEGCFKLVVLLRFVEHYPELSIKLNNNPLKV